jgi:glutamate/aspartate transport system substrate-binding protein
VRLAAALAFAALCAAAPAAAEEGAPLTGTLKAISDRGTIVIGTRDSAIPFSFLNKAGQPVGFSVDLCRGIATEVATALNRELVEPDAPAWQSGLRIVYVPLTPEARLPKVISGDVDLECGSTTANDERARTVAFSPVFFLAGTKLMLPTGSPIVSYQALGGRTVAVSTGTTNAEVMRRLAARVSPPIKVVETPDLAAAYDALAAGRADAFASDDILLAGLRATRPDGSRFTVVGDYLSYEPYAITMRRDDPDFSLVVRRSFERMAQEGTLRTLYRRWFTKELPTGENLNLPMSPHLAEMYRALGEPD